MPVVVMTAWGNVDLAVEAMRRGACDFVQKPWDNNRLLATIRKQAEPVRQRKSELEIAANVQQKLFPRKLRRWRTLDYAGHCVPAREVGGDYYDFLEIAERRSASCWRMSPARACRPRCSWRICRPASAARRRTRWSIPPKCSRWSTNTSSTPPRPSVSPPWSSRIYDDRTRKVRYVNCAHCPPLLLRANGEIEQLESTATMLGAFERWSCAEAEVELRPGDTLLLYSDGVTEAGAESGDEFGDDRLIHALRVNQSLAGGVAGAVHCGRRQSSSAPVRAATM